MKKYVKAFTAILTAIVLLGSTGCKKAENYLESHPWTELKFCQIDKFIFKDPYSFATFDTMHITYNLHGDPITGIRKQVGTGHPNIFFKYDAHHRLTDLIGDYSATLPAEGIIESWQKYFYGESNRIVKDSFYFFPTVVDGRPTIGAHGAIIIITYEYDSKNRISKAVTNFGSSSNTEIFSYDANGNRVGSGYDNKINIHRTNRIWMFLDRDYSVNNPETASYAYNAFGLPTKIVQRNGTVGTFMSLSYASLQYVEAYVIYSCL